MGADGEDIITVTMSEDTGTINIDDAAYVFSYDSPEDDKPATYTMSITLADGLEEPKADFSLTLTVKAPPPEVIIEPIDLNSGFEVKNDAEVVVEEKIKLEPLTVVYKKISKSGVIELKFSQDMNPDSDWSEKINPTKAAVSEEDGEDS